GAADALGIVETGILVATFLEIGDAGFGPVSHVFLGAERDRLGRAGLGAGGCLADGNTVGAQRALVGLVVLLRDTRNIERAALDAIAAADAVLRDEVDDPVRILHDRARRRTGLEAAGIVAMHAAVLADQPFEMAVRLLDLGIPHQRPAVLGQVVRVFVVADIDADFLPQVVPLQAGGLTGLAADAAGDVDELGDLDRLAHAG